MGRDFTDARSIGRTRVKCLVWVKADASVAVHGSLHCETWAGRVRGGGLSLCNWLFIKITWVGLMCGFR